MPLDYKLSAAEQLALLAHSKAQVLIVEYPLWRAISEADSFSAHIAWKPFWSPKRRPVPILPARGDGRSSAAQRDAGISAAQALRCRLHRLFLGHRRPPQGLRADARQLSRTVRGRYAALSLLARRALPEHHSHQPRHRFHGRLHHALHWRRRGRAFAHAAARIYPRGLHAIQDHLHGRGAADPEKPRARPARAIRGFAARKAAHLAWRSSASIAALTRQAAALASAALC